MGSNAREQLGWRARWLIEVALGLGCLLAFVGCASGPPPRGHALYAASQGPKQRSEVAQLVGPIVVIDGQSVEQVGDSFEVLPGCHIVEITVPPQGNDSVTVRSLAPSPIPFAINARGGHSYLIQARFIEEMGNIRLVLEGDELDANGVSVAEFGPANSSEELQKCLAATP